MKKLPIVILSLFAMMNCFAQGTPDILYVKTKKLDKSYMGKLVHIEFKHAVLTNGNLQLSVQNNPVQFAARKANNQRYNFFYWQYSESSGFVNGYTVRLVQSRIDDITEDSIQVTNYYDLYKGNTLEAGKSIQQQYWFDKKMISQLLIKQDGRGI